MSRPRKGTKGKIIRPDLLVGRHRVNKNGVEEKKCPKCRKWHPITDFLPDKNLWDGLMYCCKACWLKVKKKGDETYHNSVRFQVKNRIRTFKNRVSTDPELVHRELVHICQELNYPIEDVYKDMRYTKNKPPKPRKFVVINGELRYLD